MSWPADHPAFVDPALSPWAAGIDEVGLRYLPGRRVATLVTHQRSLAVVKVFASPRARGNARRLQGLAASPAAALVPAVLGSDAAGHVLAVTYSHGALPSSLSEAEYPSCFFSVGAALRLLHDSGTELDRVWDWDREVTQLRRHVIPATQDLVDTLAESTRTLAGAELAPAHRDLHPRQVVVAEDRSVTFIDLDDAAMGPRGLDLGNMLGHLHQERITGARSASATVAAGEAFLDSYGPCAGLDEEVLTAWTALSVARLASLAESRHQDLVQRDALIACCHALLSQVGSRVSTLGSLGALSSVGTLCDLGKANSAGKAGKAGRITEVSSHAVG